MTEPELRAFVRDVPDFPRPGILFRDVTPLLADAAALREAIRRLGEPFREARVDLVLGVESRGFILGAPVALELGAGLAIARKPGKLPWKVVREVYALEYGEDALELHVDAVGPGERAVVIDDVLATGGTAGAVGRLVTNQGAELAGYSFLMELGFLHGARRLGPEKVHSLLAY
jgi:adenine phosphoribosyltransferase